MNIFLLGTRAQVIKVAPVLREMEHRNESYQLFMTGQHQLTIQDLLNEFEIKTIPYYLGKSNEIKHILSVPVWFISRTIFFWWHIKKIESKKIRVIIHGDTLSTLIGAISGWAANTEVIHIESGLRSFSFINPFPEEIIRYTVFHIMDTAFCPGQWAYSNLDKYHVNKIDTGTNTIVDAVRYAKSKHIHKQHYVEPPYVLCSLHRFENIYFKRTLLHILELLEIIANKITLIFVLHPVTESRLRKYHLLERLNNNERIILLNRMNYLAFINYMSGSEFVITDGGSNQEELNILGKPTLLFRKKSERIDGLDKSVLLSNMDKEIILKFLDSYASYCNPPFSETSEISPSSIITDYLST